MQTLNYFGLKVAGMTALAALFMSGLYGGSQALWGQWHGEEPVKTTNQNANLENNLFAQFPEKLSPTPAGEVAGQTQRSKNLTEMYLASLPTDIKEEDIFERARVEAFVQAQRVDILPNVNPESWPQASGQGKEAMETYLDNVSAAHNPKLVAISNDDIQRAWLEQAQGNKSAIQKIVESLTANVALIKATPVPAEAQQFHAKLLGAALALQESSLAMMNMEADFIGGLVAARRIEGLGSVFAELEKQTKAWESLYNLH